MDYRLAAFGFKFPNKLNTR